MQPFIQLFSILLIVCPFISFGQWTQIGDDIDGTTAFENSGENVSLSDDGAILAIGIRSHSLTGTVRIFENTGGSWTQIGNDIDGEAADDESGTSVSLSGDGSTVAIGSPKNDGNGDNAGHVRVYEIRGISNWIQVGNDIDGEAAQDYSGGSVSLSADGSILAIGARYNGGNGNSSGHVRVYENIGGTWTQIGGDIDGEASEDQSGASVSLSDDGSIVAIGGTENDGSANNAGHVRVYENIGGTWTQIGGDIDGEAAGDQSGTSVNLSSDGLTVAVGSKSNSGNGGNAGHVRVYENVGDTWTQIGDDIDGEAVEDESGGKSSVSLSSDGSIVAIGAPLNDNGNGNNSGHVKVYENVEGTWTQIGDAIDGETELNLSGMGVSLSADGATVAIGAPLNDGSGNLAGHVRVYGFVCAPPTNTTSTTGDTITADATGVTYQWIDCNNNDAAIPGETDQSYIATISGDYAVIVSDGSCSDTSDCVTITCTPPTNTTSTTGDTITADAIGVTYQWIDCNNNDAAIAGETDQSYIATISGDYAVIVSNGSCSDTSDCVAITITCTPPTNTTSTTGDTITADATGVTYQWIDCNNNDAAIPGETDQSYIATASGDYAVIVSDGSCSDTSDCVAITITCTSPEVSTSTAGNTITANTAGVTYQWIDCNNNDAAIPGEINQSYIATASGDYAVIVTENSCSDTSDCVTIVVTNVDEKSSDNKDIRIYPNPISDQFTILFVKSELHTVQITNSLGKVIQYFETTQPYLRLDLTKWSKGVYIINITDTAGFSTTNKIIKQ